MTAHPGESLSAYVDGELAAEERAGIESHLGACPVCRHELAGVRQAKAWIAGLPEVLPPFGFYERMLLDPQARRRRDRWPVRAGAVGLAAMASIWLAVLGVTGVVGDGSSGLPALNSLVALHEDTARPVRAVVSDEAQHQATSLGLPGEIGTFDLTGLVDHGLEQQATYTDGRQTLSVFVLLHFDIAESRLPADRQQVWFGDQVVWLLRQGPSPVMVAQVGPNALIMVGPESAAPMVAADVEPRAPGASLMDRIEGAGEGLLEAFGLG